MLNSGVRTVSDVFASSLLSLFWWEEKEMALP
jgi:hypothetical protein